MKKLLFIVPVLFLLASCTNSTPSKPTSSNNTVQSASTVNNVTTNAPVASTPKENRTIPTPSYGSGNHTIEIFADFQCPACQGFSKTLEPILKEYAEK
jgi:protein-disulfide isomerase